MVEKKLARERGITRQELGREAFLKEVFTWKEQYGNTICSQLRRLGSSLDWSRERFTMVRDTAILCSGGTLDAALTFVGRDAVGRCPGGVRAAAREGCGSNSVSFLPCRCSLAHTARAGLIYRDNRLVNWCCALKTAISDIEVDYVELTGSTQLRVPGYSGLRRLREWCCSLFFSPMCLQALSSSASSRALRTSSKTIVARSLSRQHGASSWRYSARAAF